MTDVTQKPKDNRSFFKKVGAAVLGAVLVVAVPIAQCADCGDLPAPNVSDAREPSYEGKYVGEKLGAWTEKSEGLRYYPASVVKNLKRPVGTLKLSNELLFARPERFGMLPNPAGGYLPLGVSVSNESNPHFVPMVGITCGGCHVGAVGNGKEWIAIEGAPSFTAVNVFFGDMIGSVAATLANPAAFDDLWRAHAKELRLDEDAPIDERLLSKEEASSVLAGQVPSTVQLDVLSDAYPTIEQVDSRGELAQYLLNRTITLVGRAGAGGDATGPSPLGTSNPWAVTRGLFGANYAHADKEELGSIGGAITAPDIYNYRERKWIFWSQVTNSMLERNLAQGLALLADVDWESFDTTLSPWALEDIESQNETIEPPAWPTQLFAEVDMTKAARGCETFEQNCSGCHRYEHTVNRGSLEWRRFDVGTDDEYCKGVNASTGKFKTVPDLVRPVAAAVKTRALGGGDVTSEAGRFPVVWRTQECNLMPARSLEGIWAAAPFLHNGSVRTLDQLLLPVERREKLFNVGSIEYDPKSLGFVSNKLPHTSVIDTTSHGFSNAGHLFVVEDDEKRSDLLEYMKVHRDGLTCRFD